MAARGESHEVVAKLLRVHHQLWLESVPDKNRGDESPFAHIDFGAATPEEYSAIAKTLREAIAGIRARMTRPHVGLSDSERTAAYRKLKTQEFPEVGDLTKKQLVAAIVAKASIDPRIHAMVQIDKRTVQLIAGDRCSDWCASGLHCYIARLEGDRWIIRSADLFGPNE